jgi:arogenate/prephenate dehydratase
VHTPSASDDTVYKTSIVFSLKEGPGNLFKALSVFALRDIDMTKIENRPLRSNPLVVGRDGEARHMNHLFYVDVLGSLADENCQHALKHLQESAPFLRVLGSYPADALFTATGEGWLRDPRRLGFPLRPADALFTAT